jgi:UDP-N-acetylenolpyruvoylglucosamine reductase
MLVIREPSFKALQEILSEKQAVKFRYGSNKNVVIVDTQTAQAIIAVHRAGNDVTKAKVERMASGSAVTFQKLATFCLEKTGIIGEAVKLPMASLAPPKDTALSAAFARAGA